MDSDGICLEFSVPENDPAVAYLKNRLDKFHWNTEISNIENGCIFIITGSVDSYRMAAEKFHLRKKCNDVPPFQPFNCDNKQDFIHFDAGADQFTSAEKIFLIKKELDHFRADENEKVIPGHHDAVLYKGKSILRRLISHGIVTQIQAIHNRETVKKMRGSWLKSFSIGHIIKQPIDELDKYFGLEMGLYFNFVQHYGIGLFVLAIFILILMLLGQGQSSLISVITIVWSFVWLYSWRGAEAKRSYENGSLNTIGRGWEEARPEYFGPLSKNEITGEDEPSYPSSKYYIRCTLSYIICAICCYAAYMLMLVYYSWEKWTYDEYGIDSYVAMVPGIIYTVLVVISSQQYRRLAKLLTNFENHRTEHQERFQSCKQTSPKIIRPTITRGTV